jgi:hypothetical protein
MEKMAAVLVDRRKPGETALQLLDLICEPWRGCDAEFESTDPNDPHKINPDYQDSRDPIAPLGQLICEAFAPNGLADLARFQAAYRADPDEAYDEWADTVLAPFAAHYQFY